MTTLAFPIIADLCGFFKEQCLEEEAGSGKLGFVGERERDQRKTEPQAVQKEVFLWTPFKNFQKMLFINVFRKFLEFQEPFAKGSWWGAGVKPLPAKPQFEIYEINLRIILKFIDK